MASLEQPRATSASIATPGKGGSTPLSKTPTNTARPATSGKGGSTSKTATTAAPKKLGGGAISSLLDVGADAFANMYDVFITWPNELGGQPVASNLGVRISGFTYTPLTVPSYTVKFQENFLERPGSAFQGSRVLSLTFRSDSEYDLLDIFLRWKQMWHDPSGQSILKFGAFTDSEDLSNLYGKVVVKAYRTSPLATADSLEEGAVWIFEGALVTSVKGPNFTRDTATPAEFTVDFLYLKSYEPGSEDTGLLDTEPTIGKSGYGADIKGPSNTL